MSRFDPLLREFSLYWTRVFILILIFLPGLGFSQNFPLNIPELPPGKKVQVFYHSVVNDPLQPLETMLIGQQDSISFGMGITILSDDPATMEANDITLTPASQFACNTFNGVVYVDQSATGGQNNGSSWQNAFLNLQDALLARRLCPGSVDSILVAQGVYHPGDGSDRTVTFDIPDSVIVLGGYPSWNDSLASRDWKCYETILDGDSSYHVVTTHNVSEQTVVDGFIIRGGVAESDIPPNNRGGGWYNQASEGNQSNPIIQNCVFTDNYGSYGAAVANYGLTDGRTYPTYINCEFIGNRGEDGGAIYISYAETMGGAQSTQKYINCVFEDNFATNTGSVLTMYEYVDSVEFLNCVFVRNITTVNLINARDSDNANIKISNSIFSSNLEYGYEGIVGSSVQISYSMMDLSPSLVDPENTIDFQSGNLFNTNPMFADPQSGDYRLKPSSMAIDAGDPATDLTVFYTSSGTTVDLDLLAREVNGRIDMGVYEARTYCLPYTVYLDENGTGVVPTEILIGELPVFTGCQMDTMVVIPPISCADTMVTYDLYLVRDGVDTVLRCSDTIWVLDTIAPRINTIDMELAVNEDCMAVMPDLSGYVSDNCTLDTIIQSPEAGTPLGAPGSMVLVQLIAIDSSGNESQVSFEFEVIEVAPTIPLNCVSVISPSLSPDETIDLRILEVAPNATCLDVHEVQVTNQWGGLIWQGANLRNNDRILEGVNLCAYLDQVLTVEISNGISSCQMDLVLDGRIPLSMTSAFGSTVTTAADLNIPTARIDTGLLVTYCGYVPDPEDHQPGIHIPCQTPVRSGGVYQVNAQPDWIEVTPCSEASDTAEIIYRTWEVFDKEGQLYTLTDTIVVLRLPALNASNFIGYQEDSVYCTLETLRRSSDREKSFNAWKQPLGLHDYERPYSRLRGVTYELPLLIMEAGLQQASEQGGQVLLEYLSCVIVKTKDGEEVTIGDIVSGNYMNDLIAGASQERLNYGVLHAIYELGEDPVNILNGLYSFFPYIVLEHDDWVLSEDGQFLKVTSDWFYSGNGQSPYWFTGGWPFIQAASDLLTFRDRHPDTSYETCGIRVLVPSLESDTEACIAICLDDLAANPHCGIQIEVEEQEWAGQCPQSKGREIIVRQTCWGSTRDECISDAFSATEGSDGFVVVDVDTTAKERTFQLSQWFNLIDTIGPIFDFDYPAGNCDDEESAQGEMGPTGPSGPIGETGQALARAASVSSDICDELTWCSEDIAQAIQSGRQYEAAQAWERCHPTEYRVRSHDCAAEVYVPEIRLVDNCSGVHSVKASVEVPGGQRTVALERTATKIELLSNGDTSYLYTYTHVKDPILIPFADCEGGLIEVSYEAVDHCWNTSQWSKYIQITDDTPPTVVTNQSVVVALENNVSWVKARTFDEGSWDNCSVDLSLVRRSDWTRWIEVCNSDDLHAPYDNWVDLLVDLGVHPTHAEAAVRGGSIGEDAFNASFDVEKLRNVLDQGEVEEHFFKEIAWLWYDAAACGQKVVHGWLFDLATMIASDCGMADEHGNELQIRELTDIFDRLMNSPGYGQELAYLGGGWTKAAPFDCADACESPEVELLVMDQCCNYGIGTTTVQVEDKSNPRVVRELPDLEISCEAYGLWYQDIVETAAGFGEGGSAIDSTGIFGALDSFFGVYQLQEKWNIQTGEEGESKFEYSSISCSEKSISEKLADTLHDGTVEWINQISKSTILDTTILSGLDGIVAINCSGNLVQDVWLDLDECGNGTITRRFLIDGGCASTATPLELRQVIRVRTACGLRSSMFDLPENIGSATTPVCLPLPLSNSYFPANLGAVKVKSHLTDVLCNAISIGKEVKELNVAGQSNMRKYRITWTVKDWCENAAGTSDSWNYTQEVVAVIDPDCEVNSGVEDGTGIVNQYVPGNRVLRNDFVLYQNRPNPFEGYTVIGFELPKAADAQLTVYDVRGRALKIVEGSYERGYNEVQISELDLPTGVLYYQLDTEDFTATRKMIKAMDK